MNRALNLGLTDHAVAYFLEINHWVVTQHRNRHKIPPSKSLFSHQMNKHWDYHHASQVYELLDDGFNVQDLQDEFPKKFIEFVVDQRQTIEQRITSSLRVLYADREINKPYLEK